MEKETHTQDEAPVVKETRPQKMSSDMKSTLALVLSVVAIGFSLYGGGMSTTKTLEGPEGFIKTAAKDAGMSSRAYDKCIEDPAMRALVEEDIRETEAIAQAAQLQGIGTPFNLIVTDTQVIPVNGAYPYEFFDLIINQIKENGTIPDEMLKQFEIEAFAPEIRDAFRPFDSSSDHYRGNKDGDIIVIEYSDLECPFCSRIHPTLDKLVAEHDNVGWVYRHLPLDFHPQAMPAAIASECVAKEKGNEAFGQFIDTIFENQNKLQK